MTMYLGDQKVKITDKSKTNLLDVFNRTEGKLTSRGSNTSIRPDLLDETKYFVGLSANNYYYPVHITNFEIIPNIGIKVTSTHGAYGLAFPIKCKPNTVYTLSSNITTKSEITSYQFGITFYKADGTWSGSYKYNSQGYNHVALTSPEECEYMVLVFSTEKLEVTTLHTNICLVEGSFKGTTFTGYEPYNTQLQSPMIQANNLIPYPYYYQRYNTIKDVGLTVDTHEDGSIIVNGTATALLTCVFVAARDNHMIEPGTYYLSGMPENSQRAQYILQYRDLENNLKSTSVKETNRQGAKINITNKYQLVLWINLLAGDTYNNVTFKPMLNKGEFALPFRPYSEEPEYIY